MFSGCCAAPKMERISGPQNPLPRNPVFAFAVFRGFAVRETSSPIAQNVSRKARESLSAFAEGNTHFGPIGRRKHSRRSPHNRQAISRRKQRVHCVSRHNLSRDDHHHSAATPVAGFSPHPRWQRASVQGATRHGSGAATGRHSGPVKPCKPSPTSEAR
jgi:hypothetical protein